MRDAPFGIPSQATSALYAIPPPDSATRLGQRRKISPPFLAIPNAPIDSTRRDNVANRDYYDDCARNAVLRSYADPFSTVDVVGRGSPLSPMGRRILLPAQPSYKAIELPYSKVRCADRGLPRNLAVLAPSLAGMLIPERTYQAARNCVARDLVKDMGRVCVCVCGWGWSSAPLLDPRIPPTPRPPGKCGQVNSMALEKAFGAP